MSNAGTLAEALIAKGHKLASGGTDNHLVLWVLRPHGLTGSKVEKVCEAASISLNRNTVPSDASALSPGGVRIGAPAMTTRACTTEDFKVIADFLHRCSSIALELGVGLKFRRDRRGTPQVLEVYFAAMWDSLDVPAPCDCSSAIKPSPTLRSRSPCASWAPTLIGRLCGDHSPHRTTMTQTKCCPIFKFGSWWRLTVHLLVFYGGEHFLSMLLSANAIFAEPSRTFIRRQKNTMPCLFSPEVLLNSQHRPLFVTEKTAWSEIYTISVQAHWPSSCCPL